MEKAAIGNDWERVRLASILNTVDRTAFKACPRHSLCDGAWIALIVLQRWKLLRELLMVELPPPSPAWGETP
jgi:hypothetical protein